MRRPTAAWLLAAMTAACLLPTGCGEGGASSGATVSVYVATPLCNGARRQLSREAGAVEDLHVRAVCLPPTAPAGRANLAQAGANARRATEDSTAIAYLEAPGPAAKFARPIVESAEIAWLESNSGEKAMRQVLQALAGGDQSSPRATVREALDQVP